VHFCTFALFSVTQRRSSEKTFEDLSQNFTCASRGIHRRIPCRTQDEESSDVEVSRGAGTTYQVSRTLSRFDRGEGGLDIQPLALSFSLGAGNESGHPFCVFLFSIPISLKSEEPLASSLRGIHGPLASILRARADPGWPVKVSCIAWSQKKVGAFIHRSALAARRKALGKIASLSLCLSRARAAREQLSSDRSLRARSSWA